ncbi:PorT family protein [Halosquirtibacter xylanolyticus]|uniref:outer membrane beta-barrel protein n=1 Tax=Halosquirtibacter xylanolyticus TaxID=3374599 RepID=UPI00374A7F52|nr:PorT family protein [Prolixibacteraceae bacterium]
MKKLIIMFALCLVSMTNSFAQEKHYGVRLGYNGTHLQDNGDKVGSAENNYFISMYKDSKIMPFLFLNSGLEYTKYGGDVLNQSYELHYVGIPLGLKVKFGPLFVVGGAAFNVKVSEKNNPYSSSSKWYDTNAFAQAGLEILFLTIDAKYTWGLTDVQNNITNNGLQVGVGVRF